MTKTSAIAASKEAFISWQFRSPKKLTSLEMTSNAFRKENVSREKYVFASFGILFVPLLLFFYFFSFTCFIAHWCVLFTFFFTRMFHIDDVPSGAGEGIKDLKKAFQVS